MGMKTKSKVIKRVEALKMGKSIQELYTKLEVKQGTDKLFIDIISNYKKRR